MKILDIVRHLSPKGGKEKNRLSLQILLRKCSTIPKNDETNPFSCNTMSGKLLQGASCRYCRIKNQFRFIEEKKLINLNKIVVCPVHDIV